MAVIQASRRAGNQLQCKYKQMIRGSQLLPVRASRLRRTHLGAGCAELAQAGTLLCLLPCLLILPVLLLTLLELPLDPPLVLRRACSRAGGQRVRALAVSSARTGSRRVCLA